MKSAAISFGGMVFECLEIGVFEALLFISSFLVFLTYCALNWFAVGSKQKSLFVCY